MKFTSTAQKLYDKMLAIYPYRVNPGWASAGLSAGIQVIGLENCHGHGMEHDQQYDGC